MADLFFKFGADTKALDEAIERVKKKISELEDAGTKMNASMARLKGELFDLQSLKDAHDAFNKLIKDSNDLEKSISSLTSKLLGFAAAKALVNLTDWANNLEQTAKAVGMTTAQLIELQQAVTQAGGTALAASRGIEMFYMKLDQARQGGLMQQVAFQRIGITLKELGELDDQALFKKTIEQLSLMPASAARNRIEVELLSKSFRGIPIQQINDALDESKGKFSQYGPVLDDAGKAYRKLEQDITNFKIAILSIFQPLFKAFAELTPTVENFKKIFEALIALFVASRVIAFAESIFLLTKGFTTIVPIINAATAALRGFAAAEVLASNATGIGALINILAKVAAVAAVAGATYFGLDAIIEKNTETNKEAAKVAEDKANADKKLQNTQVFDATAKMTAMIMEQTKAFKANIQAQIDKLKTQDATAGLGEEAKAKMEEELRVREEFRRKIEELNVKLKEAQAAGPAQEVYFQQGALKKAIADLTSAQDSYTKSAGAAALEKAKNNSADQMALLLKEDQIRIQKTLSDIQINIDEMTMSSDQKKIANVQKQTNEYIKLATEKRRAQMGTNTTDEELNNDAVLQKTIKGIKEKQEVVITATQKEIDASRDWSNGWKLAFNEYKQNAQDGASTAKKLFDDATKGMEDVIVNFAKTGKLSFDQLLQTIAEDILRSQIRQLFANLFSAGGMTGGTQGGVSLFGGLGKLLGFADGGVIGTNGPVLVGERGPELISGAAGKTVTPNSAMGTNVTYNINAVDARSFQQMVAQDPSFIYAVTLRGQNMIPGGGFR